jgi:signal transduction histidine kinase
MSNKPLRKGTARLLNLPRTAEWLTRNVLLVGFMTLLLLVGALGYWSRENFIKLDEEVAALRQSEVNHDRVIRAISETSGKIQAYAITLLGNREAPLLNFPVKQRLKLLKDEMEGRIIEGRSTSLATTAEWDEFEAAFQNYWESINSPTATNWYAERDRLSEAISALDNLILLKSQENDLKAQELNRSGRNKVLAATIAILTVGFIVAMLTFREIRKVLKQLGEAYRESSESRDYLQSLLDSLVPGVIVIGQDGAVQTVSASFERMPVDEIGEPLGQDYRKLFQKTPSLAERIAAELEKDEEASRYLGRVELGQSRLFEVFASPLLITAERRGLILVFVEVTETARAQSELRRNRALAAVGQMTAQIAHEIKNPLGSIRFATEVLKRQGGQPDLETIHVIERSVDHLATVVAELSEFARPKELKRAETNLNDLLRDLLPMVADRLSGKGIEISTRFASDLPAGSFDATELRKLFLNLIINAIDASEPGSAIELRTRMNGHGEVLIEIEDHGKGMDEETLKRLFEPFYTTKEKGTGLGMAIAKKIAELHRGDLKVKSKKGVGTTAIVGLPLS